jgi:tRNA G18 (ribose-2'-O)-methylase SpoU
MNAEPPITSRQNPEFKRLKLLLSGSGIRKEQRALVSGGKLVADALRLHPDRATAWITSGTRGPEPPVSRLAHLRFAPELFGELDVFGTRSPLLVVAPPVPEAWDPGAGLPPGRSVLVPFQDPENVGAVIRSAVAFEADHVILLAECAHPFHPKALRASGGAVLGAPLLRGPALSALPETLPVIPLSREGTDIARFPFPAAGALLPGMEGPGLPAAWRGRAVSIPVAGVESLNASVAAAIALYLWRRAPGGRADAGGS